MEHKIPVISVCVNQYGEERYADIYINVNVKTLYLARSTLSNLRRIWTDKAMLKTREKHLT